MYDKNRAAKIFGYVMLLFWAGYLIFFGVSLAQGFGEMFPNREPYHVMNGSILLFILMIDMLIRIPLKTPTQEVKPYLLLPVKRNRIIDFLLIRSGMSLINLFWMFFFLPFAALTITRYWGLSGVFAYLSGIWLLFLINNFWFFLCRTLFDRHWAWILLPVTFYAGLVCLLVIPENSPLMMAGMNLGDGYITGNLLYFLGTIAVLVLLWWVNRMVISRSIYSELNKVKDTRIRRISEYRFLDRYGEIGEYMRLELKLLLRNRRCKSSLQSILLAIVLFSGTLTLSSAYDGMFLNSFVTMYSYSMFGTIILLQLLSFEGNYIDGLMTRKESIHNLLKAKYYTYCFAQIIPFALMIPAIMMEKVSLLSAFAWSFFTIGFTYFGLFQLSAYNKQTVPLNEKLSMRQTNSGLQIVVSLITLSFPLMLFHTLSALWNEQTAYYLMLGLGLAFVLTSPRWINNVYLRFMARRYENLEGFRNSRQ